MMTNRNTIRKYLSSSPNTLHNSLVKHMFEDLLGNYYIDPFNPLTSNITKESVGAYVERTKDGEEFTVYTKGDYPKLRILKNITEDTKELKGLNVIAAVPGLLEDEINVNTLGQEITIELTPKGKIDENLLILNELPNRYSKSVIGVTGPFDMDKIEAKFEGSGIINIFIPAIEKPKSKKLDLGKR